MALLVGYVPLAFPGPVFPKESGLFRAGKRSSLEDASDCFVACSSTISPDFPSIEVTEILYEQVSFENDFADGVTSANQSLG